MASTWNVNREYDGIEISFDGKPSEEIRNKMKAVGFKWSSAQMKWYAKDNSRTRQVANELATQEEDVGEHLTFEQKMERDKERAEHRQERLGAKAENLEKKSEDLLDKAHKMAAVIPFGQPILVGHHSEGRDRRYRGRIHDTFGKGFETMDEAKEVSQRLEGSQALSRKRETPGYMSRKIDQLEADLRKFERDKGQWQGQLAGWEKRTNDLKEQITYWKKELGEAGGLRVTPADVKAGDEILYLGTWYEVVRVNPKTVTIKNWLDIPTWTWGAEYSKIKAVRQKETKVHPLVSTAPDKVVSIVERSNVQSRYPDPTKSTTPKVFTYYFRNRPPDIGTFPKGAVMKEAWIPKRATEKGNMAWGWASYERELTPDELYNYELFVDEIVMPKLVPDMSSKADIADLAEEIKDNKGEIVNGKAILYHFTTPEAKKQIEATGIMYGKEDGIFFSTRSDGQAKGYGSAIVKVRVPLGQLELDDTFGDEAHLRIPTAKAGQRVRVEIVPYPVKMDTSSKDYKAGYNLAIQGRIAPAVPAWTDQGQADFAQGYKDGTAAKAKQDTKKFIEEFGKPIPITPEKQRAVIPLPQVIPRYLGVPSRQKRVESTQRAEAQVGKKLRGQQTLTSAVSTSQRLSDFEEKPKISEPERITSLPFKRPIPFFIPGRVPYKKINVPPRQLYGMEIEQADIEEERHAKELANQAIAEITMQRIKKQIEKAKQGFG